MRQLPATNPTLLVLFLCAFAALSAVPARAAVAPPPPYEPPSTGKRVAARALQRTTSMEWPSDVAARLRLLEEHAERAAREHRTRNRSEASR